MINIEDVPSDFITEHYRLLNKDLSNLNKSDLIHHYLIYGVYEKRTYKIPDDFNVNQYKALNSDLSNMNEKELIEHFLNFGYHEKRKYYIENTEEIKQDKKKLETEMIPINNGISKLNRLKSLNGDSIVVVARYNENISNFSRFSGNLLVYNKGSDDIDKSINENYIIKTQNLGRESETYLKHIIDYYDNLYEYMIFVQGNPVDHIYHDDIEKSFNEILSVLHEKKDYKFKFISRHMSPLTKMDLIHDGSGIPSCPIELGNPKDIKELIFEIREWINNKCPNEVCINPLHRPHDDPGNGIERELNNMINQGKTTIYPWEFTKVCIKDFWYLTSGTAHKMREDILLKFDYSFIEPKINNGYEWGYGSQFIVHRDQILRKPLSFWKRLYETLQEDLPSTGWALEKLWRFILE